MPYHEPTPQQKIDHARRERFRIRCLKVRDYLREKHVVGLISMNLNDFDLEFVEKIEARMERDRKKEKSSAAIFEVR